MRQDFDNNEESRTAVRTQSHHQPLSSSDIFPAFAYSIPGGNRRIAEFDLQAGKYFPVTGSEDAVVADVDEAVREDMLGIAPHELHPADGHLLDLAVIAVVLILEGDILVIHGKDARVSDGHAVGIAGEILQRALRSADRTLCIDHPRLGKALGPNCTRDFSDRG